MIPVGRGLNEFAMSTASDTTLADPQQVIADLRRANDELRRTMDERTR